MGVGEYAFIFSQCSVCVGVRACARTHARVCLCLCVFTHVCVGVRASVQEADYAGKGTTARGHSRWRNYDDFNEFFW